MLRKIMTLNHKNAPSFFLKMELVKNQTNKTSYIHFIFKHEEETLTEYIFALTFAIKY